MGNDFPDLMTLMVNVGEAIAPIIMAVQVIAGVMGLWLSVSGLITIWQASDENSRKFMSSQANPTNIGGFVQLFIGACLISVSTLMLVGIMSRTLTGDYANSRFMSYSSAGTTFNEQACLAEHSLMGILQIVGLIAIIKGYMTVNDRFSGRAAQAGMGTAIAWLVGGVLCWNFKWFADMLNNTFKYKIIGFFGGVC